MPTPVPAAAVEPLMGVVGVSRSFRPIVSTSTGGAHDAKSSRVTGRSGRMNPPMARAGWPSIWKRTRTGKTLTV